MRRLTGILAWVVATFLVGAVAWQTVPGADQPGARGPTRAPKYDHFMLGVFVGSSKEVLAVPLTKVFTDFLTHGIKIVCIGQNNYFPLARNKNLNTFAKANGVQFICNMFMPEPYDGEYSDETFRAAIQAEVDAVNALPDSDVVVGWRIGDEIECHVENLKQDRALAEKNFQRFSHLIRAVDPKRRVVVNHCAGIPWITVHEDEALSSTMHTGIYNSYRVRQEIAQARGLGFDNYLLVALPQRCPPGIGNVRYYGYREPINDAVLDSRTVPQHVQDYAEVAYTEGAAGICYFVYWAGGDNYEAFSLVDLHGDDYQGKWGAVRQAAQNIRQWEGAPACAIVSPRNRSWTLLPFTVTVEAGAPVDDPVKAVKADYSLDGALSWTPLPDAVKPPFRFTVDADKVQELPGTVWIRARAVNKRGPSLWNVIEIRCSR